MDNTDDHEKNHTLLVTDAQRYELSPAYDILPSGQALGFQQMRVGEQEADSTRDIEMYTQQIDRPFLRDQRRDAMARAN